MLAVALYGVSMMHSVFLWRKGFRRDTHVNYLLLLGAFGFHTVAMLMRGLRLNHCPVSNLYEATAFVMWTIVARLPGGRALVAPAVSGRLCFARALRPRGLRPHAPAGYAAGRAARAAGGLDQPARRVHGPFLRRFRPQFGGGRDVSFPGTESQDAPAQGASSPSCPPSSAWRPW